MNVLQMLEPSVDRESPDDASSLFRGRRRMLLGGALAALFSTEESQGYPAPTDSTTHWLVRRLTYGITPAELARADSMGFDAYLDQQLDYTQIDDSAVEARVAHLPSLPLEPYQLFVGSGSLLAYELIEAAIIRAVFSQRQLFERMVEFWTDHFNIDIDSGMCRYLKTHDDRTVIRAHALGTFPQLLAESARSPAMLHYLGNVNSVAGNPNENYAREVMELHTLGVDGGYTQQDVVEVARCFTGWTLHPATAGTDYLKFLFDPAKHDTGQKMVLGNVIPAGGGISDGDAVLSILASHHTTANRIATKLCKWFYSEDPPQSLIDRVALEYNNTGGDIKKMVGALFRNADPLACPFKYKRPFHHYVSALRATNTDLLSTNEIQVRLGEAGHKPFNWGPPDGYPDTLSYWSANILPRWNFGGVAGAGSINGTSFPYEAFFQGTTTMQEIADRLDQNFFCGTMPAAQKTRIMNVLLPAPNHVRKRDCVAVTIGCPAFQWY